MKGARKCANAHEGRTGEWGRKCEGGVERVVALNYGTGEQGSNSELEKKGRWRVANHGEWN